MTKRTVLVLITFGVAGMANAMFMRPDLEKIPIDRLIKNLEAKLKAHPGDPALLKNLARTHAMAFSQKMLDGEQVNVKRGKNEPFFGFIPPRVPYARQKKRELKADQKKKVRAHLDKALEIYRKLAAKNAKDIVLQLNLAWCNEKAGKKDEAIKSYREIVKETWKEEQKARFGSMKGFATMEVIGYLIPLLDTRKDADEIKDLLAKKQQLSKLPRPMTPVAVPTRKGVGLNEMVDRKATVRFDLDGSGRRLKWQWLTKDAAWLVYDKKSRGKIDSAIQMFGNRTFMLFLEHGYRALALLDDNNDGVLKGKELDGISIWHDLNTNGRSEVGEVKSLTEWGITAVSCRSSKHTSGIQFAEAGVTFADGSVRPSYDVILKRSK